MQNVRFLVVDDSAMARTLIASIIRRRLGSDRIVHASNGKEAILRLQEQPIDIIVSDWNMEEINGAELLEYVRRHGRLRLIPFLMVTTNNRREFIVNAFRLGVTHYLVKPFTPAELEQRIRTAWHNAARRDGERHRDLPSHRVLLRSAERLCAGELQDLSRSGALLRVKATDAPRLELQCELSISLTDAGSGQQWLMPRVFGTTVRVEPQSDGSTLVALRFDADMAEQDVAAALDDLIAWLAARAIRPAD
jgi:CheY-like chemotaxis protein